MKDLKVLMKLNDEKVFTLINGRAYPIWESIVRKKEKYIGGTLVSHDNFLGDEKTILIDMRLEPYQESCRFMFEGGAFNCWSIVESLSMDLPSDEGFLHFDMGYGMSWTIYEKGKSLDDFMKEYSYEEYDDSEEE